MPGRFFTDAERERLDRFPEELPPEDLAAHFTLTASDHSVVRRRRGDHSRLGFALQLCALRYLGFAPDALTTAPPAALAFLARQLDVSVPPGATAGVALREVLAAYDRDHTRTDHLGEILKHLGFRDATDHDLAALSTWLLERALEHDKPSLLFQLACERLREQRVVRPGVTRLERLVVAVRERAQEETYRRLAPFLSTERCTALDALLTPDAASGRTPLAWLRRGATAATPRAILVELEKLAFTRATGAAAWDLVAVGGLTPNRVKFLAQVGKRSTNQALQRTAPARRYPILLAFLRQMVEELTDEVIDLFDRCLGQAYSRAGRELDEFRRSVARATNEKVILFRDLGRLVLDPAVADQHLRAAIARRLPLDKLRTAVEECDRLVRPLDDNYFDLLADRYGYLRQFTPALLAACTFRSTVADDPLLDAVALLRRLNEEERRGIPRDAPLGFVPPKWKPYVVSGRGRRRRIDRRYYELCALTELRSALRAGDVWLVGSRRYADPDSYLIAHERWPAMRAEACRLMQAPPDGAQRLHERQQELEDLLARFDARLAATAEGAVAASSRANGANGKSPRGHASTAAGAGANANGVALPGRQPGVRIVDGALVVPPLAGMELPERVALLQQRVAERLPPVELADLLIEVDSWAHFSGAFEHAGARHPRSSGLLTHLYATVLAQACNFGLATMAEVADLTYDRLAWCTTWYVREETLRSALTAVVNYQHRQPLSRHWGSGTLSSSDGQRFPVSVKARNATALPRYFGLGRGVTFYTWTSDQFSQYGTKVIPATVRDATYVLDEILDNETELPIAEHTTDTAGYTELVFALFDLLGLRFSPRIRDLADQRLYRLDRTVTYRHLEPLLHGCLSRDLILGRWDDLLRVAGSLKLGWVTASLLVGKLQARRRHNALTRALQEYGRLVKTIFILRYLESEEYRRRITAQLNKGESLHALRRFLVFANEGQLRRRQPDEQANQASCLNLVTNAIVTWNTVYMADALDQLRAQGEVILDEDVAHLSPALYGHVNPYGKYRFDVDAGLRRTQRRPLRQPQELQPVRA
jgi:TnpA family transposase